MEFGSEWQSCFLFSKCSRLPPKASKLPLRFPRPCFWRFLFRNFPFKAEFTRLTRTCRYFEVSQDLVLVTPLAWCSYTPACGQGRSRSWPFEYSCSPPCMFFLQLPIPSTPLKKDSIRGGGYRTKLSKVKTWSCGPPNLTLEIYMWQFPQINRYFQAK